MTKKEHRIPIRVSSVLRILEGKQDNTLEQVVVPARGPVKLTDAKEAEKPLPAAVVKSQVKDAEQKQHQQEVREVAISFSSPVQTRSPQLPQVVPSANTAHEPEELEKEIAVLQQKLQAKEQKQLPTEFEIPVPSKPVIVEDINVLNLRVAYFCMEIGITNDLQFYAGGLGILAGDMLKSCADLDVPVVGISLFYRKGYMTQWLDESGWQFENMETIVPDARFVLLRERVTIEIEGRKVTVAAWLHKLKGIGGSIVPILFLDTDLPENAEQDRSITHDLYQGDHRYRIKQEAVLGIAGVRMLEKISATRIEKFHMNEGHSAFLTVELYRKVKDEESAVERVRDHAVFTTHTPVAAGHDKFDASLVHEVLGDEYIPNDLIVHATEGEGLFNMTKLGMYLSGHTNGVAKRHSEVTREMFPGYRIESITNGVYAREWISESIKQLYKKYLPDWEHDPYCLRYALSIPQEELWQAHIEAKRTLFTYVKQTTGIDMQEEVFTIGFARRATGYKRAELLWSDMERLKSIASRYPRGIQVIFAGKAHPGDHESKLMIQRIVNKMRDAGPNIKAVYLPNYNMNIAKLLVAGVDIWMNTPTRPQEASGTSGMKAALNGVPHFSVLDGWWIEGHIEHVTGWSIGPHPEEGKESSDAVDREDMYTKLEYVVLARYYQERDAWIKMMRHAIAINGSFFNTHRMVEQYVLTTYFK